MNLKKKTTEIAEAKPQKLRNKTALKQGSFAIAFTAIVIAVIVGVNALVMVLAERTNLELDLTAKGTNTLTEENIAYLQKVEDEVVITVCLKKEDYVDGVAEVAANYKSVQDAEGSASALDYFEQTINLLSQYNKYNDHITIKYVDPYSPEFTEIKTEYADADIGDIIVECIKVIDQEESKRGELLTFDDIYTLESVSASMYLGYKSYNVVGNNIESVLTSAIYKVTSDETPKALVVEHHCRKENVKDYAAFLGQNNFDIEYFSDNFLTEIDKEIDMMIIAEPREDFTPEEIEAISEWLYNEGNFDKGLLFFAAVDSPDTPNLDSFLEEWGIVLEDGVQYETNDGYYYNGDHTVMPYFPSSDLEGSEDTVIQSFNKALAGTTYCLSGENVPISTLFKEEGGRLVTPLLKTYADTTVIAPLDRANDWTPDGSLEQNQHYGVVASSESEYDSNNKLHTSYVITFASRDFINSAWFVETKVNANAVLSLAKVASSVADDGITFQMRRLEGNYFEVPATALQINIMSYIFQWGCPLILVAAGVVVFVRRLRR